MSSLMEELTKATDPKYKMCGKTPSVESVILFVCSVLRCNLEIERLQRELQARHGSPVVVTAKPCIRECRCGRGGGRQGLIVVSEFIHTNSSSKSACVLW